MNENRLDDATLHALIDGELSADERILVVGLLAKDNARSAFAAEHQRLKASVAALSTPELPEGAWKRCQGRLGELDRAKRTERFVSQYAWGLCGLVLCTIIVGGSLNRTLGRHLGTGEVTRMASSLSPFARADNPPSASVGKWLQDSVGQVPIRRLDVVRTVCAEAGTVDGHKMARLTLADSQGSMILLIIPGSESVEGLAPVENSPYNVGHLGGMNCISWHQEDCSMVLIGGRSPDGLEVIAQAVGASSLNVAPLGQ